MSEPLKPCPFCGGEAELWNAHDSRPAWIACMGRCAVLISKEHTTDAEAIAAWNTRATPAANASLDAKLARLVEALDMSRQGWRNALELDLLPKQHRHSAKTMADVADAALAEVQARDEGAILRADKARGE